MDLPDVAHDREALLAWSRAMRDRALAIDGLDGAGELAARRAVYAARELAIEVVLYSHAVGELLSEVAAPIGAPLVRLAAWIEGAGLGAIPHPWDLAATLAGLASHVAMLSFDDCAIEDVRRLDRVASEVHRAAGDLFAWLDERALTPKARALAELCVCGVDRGEHLVEPPHATEDGGCKGFVADRPLSESQP